MGTYQSPTGIQTFQNNLGLNLCVVPLMSHRITVSEKGLGRRNY